MKNNQYNPPGLWHEYDFLVNKHYWSKQGYDASISKRILNLQDLTQLLKSNNLNYWLQGQTLKGVFLHDQLPDDHDDDIGIWFEDYEKLIHIVKPLLEKNGFTMIRNTGQIVSFERDFRYIDICIFQKISKCTVQYAQKAFPLNYYESFSTIAFADGEYTIPTQSDLIIKLIDKKKKQKIKVLLNRLQSLIKLTTQTEFRNHLINKVKALLIAKTSQGTKFSKFLLLFLGPIFGIYLIRLSQADFENLQIEPNDSYNWRWRKRHLDLVTEGGKHRKISDIIKYISNRNVKEEINNQVVESDMRLNLQEPLNLDMDFWWSGNNYFWYCIKYKFRKNVASYAKSLQYINQKRLPTLYSAEYYESLPEMSPSEIESFLHQHPIEVINNNIVGGKHRAFAMIGRLVNNHSYLSVYALVTHLK